jgi:hypothetical protein
MERIITNDSKINKHGNKSMYCISYDISIPLQTNQQAAPISTIKSNIFYSIHEPQYQVTTT